VSCILVVDDDDDTREALRALLEDEGFAVRTAADGNGAISDLGGGDPPALVFLDASLPGPDGRKVLDWLGSRRDLDSVPVVLVTADPSGLAHERAVAVLRKPYDLDDLLRFARKFCSGG
jgi:CheY-like chemotaxis protein